MATLSDAGKSLAQSLVNSNEQIFDQIYTIGDTDEIIIVWAVSSTLYKSSQSFKGRISCDQTITRGHKCLSYLNQL